MNNLSFKNKCILLVMLSISLVACQKKQAPEKISKALTKMTLGIGYIPDVQFAPLYVGISAGFYREAGIDLTIENGFSTDVYALLSADKIDMGLTDSDQLILAVEQGVGLQAFYQYYLDYPVSIIANSDIIAEPIDFSGKVIGTPRDHGSTYIGLQLFLKQYKLEGLVRIENIGYSQINSLLSGQVAGVSVFYNNEAEQLELLPDININRWDVRDFSELPGAAFIASSIQLQNKEELYRSFSRATAKATDFVLKNQEASLEIVRDFVEIEDAQLEKIAAVLRASSELFGLGSAIGVLNKQRYEELMETAEQFELIENSYDLGRAINLAVWKGM